ncbi:major facilitator superfamily domain-containing protein [Sphaerosporella brunnea]|uniref:Major facilitator superfamily domain-containing protein n=1 Tax=Sphaerosporella brunnea TaxID=1250544 RepID=A0A5J5F1R8_9PEZI|nr:major facilitator superfamily domain-containing protein [Sphaerosporella brunnea]
MVKNSVLVYYKALFERYNRVKWIIWAAMLIVNVGAITLSLSYIWACQPLWISFKPLTNLPDGWYCADVVKLACAATSLHISTDFAMILIPMPVLAGLQIPRKQKLTLMFLFGLGGFVAVLQVVRAYYFQKAVQNADVRWNDAGFLWASVTGHVGIIVGSIPMLKPLLSNFCCLYQVISDYRCMESGGGQDSTPSPTTQRSANSSVPTRAGPPRLPRLNTYGISEHEFSVFQSTKKAMPLLIMLIGPIFLAGLAFGILDVMHKKFEAIRDTNTKQSLGVHSAFYGAYAIAAITYPGLSLKGYGFQSTMAVGLFTYSVACMAFWPSAILHSFPGLTITMIVLGAGCGILEISINAFIVLIGPQEYAEVRVNFMEGCRSIGALIPLLMESTRFYSSVDTLGFSTFLDSQWVLLGCGFVAFILAGIVCCARLPEFQDQDPPFLSSAKCIFRGPYGLSFTLAMWVLFLYAGGQEIIRLFSRHYLVLGINVTDSLALKLEESARGLFAAGRFATAGLLFLLRPRWLLLLFTIGLLIASALAVTTSEHQGIVAYLLNASFQGPMYPTIFVVALRGLGRDLKAASMLLVASLGLGGVVWPVVFYSVSNSKGTVNATPILVACFGALIVYPLFLSLVPAERERIKRVDDNHALQSDGGQMVQRTAHGFLFGTRRRSSASVVGFRRDSNASSRRGSGETGGDGGVVLPLSQI